MKKSKELYKVYLLGIVGVLLLAVSVVLFFRAGAGEKDGLDMLDLSQMQIVLPGNSTETEDIAAAELQSYVAQITGITLEMTREGSGSGSGIYVGNTRYAQQNHITWPAENSKKGEAWAIRAIDGNLVLCGAENRGVLYAVYHLLEDVLGIRWWNLWEEKVPTGEALVPAQYADSGVPVMEYRDIYIGGYVAPSDYLFYVRNRLNGNFLIDFPEAYGGKESYGLPAHTHTFNRYFPASFNSGDTWLSAISTGGDFSSNPEWYAMDESGNRIPDGQLCLSNSGLREEFASRLLKNIAYCQDKADREGKPRPTYYAVVPNDYERYCQCTDCQTVIEQKGYSHYVLSLVNELADKVMQAGYTDVVLEMLAYWNYVEPPRELVPRSNVQIRFADNYTDLLHGLNHSNNADTLARLREWSELCSNDLYYWQYVVNYNNNGIVPSMFHYGETFTALAEMGVDGWFAEQEQCINVDFWDMKLWLITKLMENPVTGDEYTALMDEFIYGYYGEDAGKYIREYLYYMHEKAEKSNVSQDFGAHIIGAEWLAVGDILVGNEYFEKAFAAADGDEILLRRLRRARSGLDRVIVENFARWSAEAKENGLSLPFTRQMVGERIYQTMQEQIELRGIYDADYPQFFNRYDGYGDDQSPLPEALKSVPRERILEYTVSDFRLAYDYAVVDDEDSMVGKTVRCDATTQVAVGNNALLLTEYNGIDVALFDPEAPDGVTIKVIGSLNAKDVQTESGYQLYRFRWTVPPEISSAGVSAYVYILSDWGIQISQMVSELQNYAGQTVEVCLSLKALGTVDGSEPQDYPVYYIDRLLVITPET